MIYKIESDKYEFSFENTNIEELDTNLDLIPQWQEVLAGSKFIGFKYTENNEEEDDN